MKSCVTNCNFSDFMLLYFSVRGIIMGSNNDRQEFLNAGQIRKKEKKLHEMRREIKRLEKNLKYLNLVNLKIGAVKNLKISLKFMQLVVPYVLTAGIVTGGFKLVGFGFPFYGEDSFKENSNTMKEFDSLGNVRYEQQYDHFENSNNILCYCSQWQRGDDGFYSRNVETYKLDELTEEEIQNLFYKENLNLSDVLGEPISIKKETKNNVTEEELQQKDYLQAIIYIEDENDYIFRKETVAENIASTFIYVLMTLSAEIIVVSIREKKSSFKFGACVNEIKRQHQDVSTEELVKRLEIKRNNYNRLTRR